MLRFLLVFDCWKVCLVGCGRLKQDGSWFFVNRSVGEGAVIIVWSIADFLICRRIERCETEWPSPLRVLRSLRLTPKPYTLGEFLWGAYLFAYVHLCNCRGAMENEKLMQKTKCKKLMQKTKCKNAQTNTKNPKEKKKLSFFKVSGQGVDIRPPAQIFLH